MPTAIPIPRRALAETDRRRAIQEAYNAEHGVHHALNASLEDFEGVVAAAQP